MYFKQYKKFIYIKRKTFGLYAVIFMTCFMVFGFSGKSNACAWCYPAAMLNDVILWHEAEDIFDNTLQDSFIKLQKFIVHEMWEQSILPVMMLSAEQLTIFAMQQAMAIGMFIDAESQMDAQRLLQEIRAKAHKDYQPSIGLCEFGSVMKSLAATERRAEITAVILAQRSQDRQLGQRDSSGRYGNELDQAARITQFKGLFCNIKSRGNVLVNPDFPNNALLSLCSSDVNWSDTDFDEAARLRMDKDIDYFSLVDSPWNLSLDFTNKKILDDSSTPKIHNEDEEHILAMASNLYAHTNFARIPPRLLTNNPNKKLTTMQDAYMDMRAVIAKRSVAENSFYAIAAMKAEGNKATSPSGGGGCSVGAGSSGKKCAGVGSNGEPSSDPVSGSIGGPQNSRIYMEHILKELGVPAADVLKLLGENPSYYAQMEILTKKIYQNPDFYTNLYDKPANIERKTVALQAIKLMQKFDILKSFLRGEATSSILLELAVSDLQGEIEDQIQTVGIGGRD